MEKISASDVKVFARDYWSLVKLHKGLFWVCLLWILIMQIVGMAEPYAIKRFLDFIVVRGAAKVVPSFPDLLRILAMIAGVFAVSSIVQVTKNKRIVRLIFLNDRDITVRCAGKLIRLPLTFHEREDAGLLISKITKGIGETRDISGLLLYEILALVLQIAVTAAIIGWYGSSTLAVFGVTVTAFSFVTYRVKQRLAPMRKRRHDDDEASTEKLSEDVANIATVQSFAQEDREISDINEMRDGIYKRAVAEYDTHFRFDFLRNGVVNVGRLCVFGIMGWAAMRAALSIGTFVFIVALSDRVFVSCYRIGAIFDRMQEASESIHRMVEVLDTEESVKDPPNPVEAPQFEGRITFENLTHQYQVRHPRPTGKTTKPALSDIRLDIRPGEMIGIVGPSGGGKSTLVKMLLRVDDPTEGRVCIDNINLRHMRRADFRRQIGYVPQDVEVFNKTIAENISFGRRDASREEITGAAKAANLHDFIMTREKGYDEVVGNHGWRLSGGQKQRLGIARALLMDARILVLDEATSSVDSISERKIQESTSNIRTGRTTLVIAHRLSTVKDADRIVVIDEGRIKEIGTHDELKAKAGLYAELIRLQQEAEAAV